MSDLADPDGKEELMRVESEEMWDLLIISACVHAGTILIIPWLPKILALILCDLVFIYLLYTSYRLYFTEAGLACTEEEEITTWVLKIGVWLQAFMQMVALIVGCLMVEVVLDDKFSLYTES